MWIGKRCEGLNQIGHLAWCNKCQPRCATSCVTCDTTGCKCPCHSAADGPPIMNTMLHMFFCPKLPLFWHNIHELALALSIYFPSEPHLLKWAMVSAHLSSFQKQPMIDTWQAIYNIYINIIYYDHYFPKPHVNILINQFNSRLLLKIKAEHRLLKTRMSTNIADSINSDPSEKNKQLITTFRRTWCHPHLCTLEDDMSIDIHYSPQTLTSHLKKQPKVIPIPADNSFTARISRMSATSRKDSWIAACQGY